MRRLLLLALALLMLTGCQTDEPDGTMLPSVTAPGTEPTQPDPGILDAEDPVAAASGGALQAYNLDGSSNLLAVYPMNGKMLLVSASQYGSYVLNLLEGDEGRITARMDLHGASPLEETALTVSDKGVAYYDSLEHSLVILDNTLQPVMQFPLPDYFQGKPVISGDLSLVYYCDDDHIRAIELSSGIDWMIKKQNCQSQSLIGLALEDKVLLCDVSYEDGSRDTVFVSTENGLTLGADDGIVSFADAGQRIFLRHRDGLVLENLICSPDGSNMQLFQPVNEEDFCALLPDGDGLFTAGSGEKGLVLGVYSLETGLCNAQLTVPGAMKLLDHAREGSYIWFLAGDETGNTKVLYRWDTAVSKAEDTQNRITRRYTREAPDEAALAQCQAMAQAISDKYGVLVTILPQDIRQPQEHRLTSEYQTAPLAEGLAVLDAAMSRFPEGFFKEIVEDTQSEILQISLVRQISGDKAGLQYWIEADSCMALTLGEGLEEEFYHNLCHVLENYIYANSRDLDVWNKLNPKGFEYDYSYDLYQTHDDKYLTGDDRAFVDAYSRTYPKEDRAAVFARAMMPGNEALFASKTMQEKLHLFSFSLRDAFNWKRSELEYPWEQYLQESLAYKKNK